MIISIDTRVFALFPEFTRFVLAAEDIDNTGGSPELEALLRAEEAAIRADGNLADVKSDPRLAAWRDAFAAFGVNPNQCPPSNLNLIKRTRGGKDLPFINKMVTIFNICSLRHRIPAGGDDRDAISGNLELREATGTEQYHPLGGGTPESPKAGEIILADDSGIAFCRAWCWRNSETTKIQESTKRALVNLDILPPVPPEEGEAAAAFAAGCMREHCGAAVAVHRLCAANPSFSL